MTNKNQIEGNWKQIKGKIRETYGDITDDELEQMRGQGEQFEGKLQERTGDTQGAIRDLINSASK